MPQAANKPITYFNWYQVFGGFHWLSCDCKGNHFSQHNTTFIIPSLRSYYLTFQNKHMLVTHISEKLKFQKHFLVLQQQCKQHTVGLRLASDGNFLPPFSSCITLA